MAPPSLSIPPMSPPGTTWTFQTILGTDITDETLAACAMVFSQNYGVWGKGALSISPYTRPGTRTSFATHPMLISTFHIGHRVRMTPAKLRGQCIGIPEKTVLSICMKDGVVVGHAFATVWQYEGGQLTNFPTHPHWLRSCTGVVGWITQLVVDVTVRKRYVATKLLQCFKDHVLFEDVTAIGLVSSHPAACHALAKYASRFPPALVTTEFYAVLRCSNQVNRPSIHP